MPDLFVVLLFNQICAYYPGAKPGKKHALNKQYALLTHLHLLTRIYGIVMMIEFIVCLFLHYLLSEHITIIFSGKRQSSSMDQMVLDTAQAGANSCNAVMRAVAQSLLRVT